MNKAEIIKYYKKKIDELNKHNKLYFEKSSPKISDKEYDEIREYIYGMPYNEWKNKHQKEATKEQMEQFNKNKS